MGQMVRVMSYCALGAHVYHFLPTCAFSLIFVRSWKHLEKQTTHNTRIYIGTTRTDLRGQEMSHTTQHTQHNTHFHTPYTGTMHHWPSCPQAGECHTQQHTTHNTRTHNTHNTRTHNTHTTNTYARARTTHNTRLRSRARRRDTHDGIMGTTPLRTARSQCDRSFASQANLPAQQKLNFLIIFLNESMRNYNIFCN